MGNLFQFSVSCFEFCCVHLVVWEAGPVIYHLLAEWGGWWMMFYGMCCGNLGMFHIRTRWWQLKYFSCSSRSLGKCSNFDQHFSRGWNHQSEDECLKMIIFLYEQNITMLIWTVAFFYSLKWIGRVSTISNIGESANRRDMFLFSLLFLFCFCRILRRFFPVCLSFAGTVRRKSSA